MEKNRDFDGTARPPRAAGTERKDRRDRPARPDRQQGAGRYEKAGGYPRPDRPAKDEGQRERGPAEAAEGGAEQGDRPDRGARRPFTRQQDIMFLKDLDAELMRTIAKRTAVLDRLKDKGRLPASVEKELRVAWETRAYNQSKDNKLARDMFLLLQALEPSTVDKEQNWFNLCPSTAPAEVNLNCTADPFWSRCHMALASASGQEIRLTEVPLSDTVIDCCKALNQLGSSLWWENPQIVHHRESKGLQGGLDKVVHVGEDDFNLWLVLALSLGQVNQIKFTGGKKSHFPGLGKLKSWLPAMGARLSSIVPSQDGLPVRLESSGMLPGSIEVDPELPLEFVCALLLAAPFWEGPIWFKLREIPPILGGIVTMLSDYGVQAKVDGNSISVQPSGLKLPAEPHMPPDLGLAVNFLSLPAFCSGTSQLNGSFNLAGPGLALVDKILKQAGLQVDQYPDKVVTRRAQDGVPALTPELIALVTAEAPDLFPLLVVLGAHQAHRHSQCFFSLPADLDPDLRRIMDSFLTQLNLAYDDQTLAVIRAEGQKTPAWLSPDAWWAMAFGWAALFRPNLLLVNPGVVTSDYPPFWNAYNTLPRPEISRKPKEEPVDVKPARRRIIAKGAYFTPPAQPAGDDD